jgi:DNA-binding PadR family transcriptional regulator
VRCGRGGVLAAGARAGHEVAGGTQDRALVLALAGARAGASAAWLIGSGGVRGGVHRCAGGERDLSVDLLATRFAELCGPGWAINRGQVSEILHNLEGKGWVESLGPPETARGSQRYQIKPEGEHAFATWISKSSPHARPHRATLYLKLVLAGPQNMHHLLKAIDAQKQACVDQLNAYTTESARRPPANASEWETLAREMIDEDVTTRLDGELDLLEKMRKRVEHRLLKPQNTGDQPWGSTASPPTSMPQDEAA